MSLASPRNPAVPAQCRQDAAVYLAALRLGMSTAQADELVAAMQARRAEIGKQALVTPAVSEPLSSGSPAPVMAPTVARPAAAGRPVRNRKADFSVADTTGT